MDAQSPARKGPRHCLLLCFLALNCFSAFGSRSLKLASEEVNALRHIAKQVGKRNWDFSLDPCSGQGNWRRSEEKGFESYVDCDCSFNNNTRCHVVRMYVLATSSFFSASILSGMQWN
ncbi:hypothetical protein ACLOJK_008658 [Asimina triloba]